MKVTLAELAPNWREKFSAYLLMHLPVVGRWHWAPRRQLSCNYIYVRTSQIAVNQTSLPQHISSHT
jgi:hypothetical protein